MATTTGTPEVAPNYNQLLVVELITGASVVVALGRQRLGRVATQHREEEDHIRYLPYVVRSTSLVAEYEQGLDNLYLVRTRMCG